MRISYWSSDVCSSDLAVAGIDHLSLRLELTDDLGIDMDVRRHLGNRVADFLEEVEFDRGAAAPIVAGSDLQAGPLALEPVCLVRLVAGRGLVFLIQSLLQALDPAIRLARLDQAVPLA